METTIQQRDSLNAWLQLTPVEQNILINNHLGSTQIPSDKVSDMLKRTEYLKLGVKKNFWKLQDWTHKELNVVCAVCSETFGDHRQDSCQKNGTKFIPTGILKDTYAN